MRRAKILARCAAHCESDAQLRDDLHSRSACNLASVESVQREYASSAQNRE